MIKENGGDIKSGSLDRRTHVWNSVAISHVLFHLTLVLIPSFSGFSWPKSCMGRSLGMRLTHCSEVQKTDTKFVVGNSKYICCGWWDGEWHQKVAKGWQRFHIWLEVTMWFKKKHTGKHFVAGFLAHLNCGHVFFNVYIGISHYASATLNEGCLHSCCLKCQPCKGDKGVSHFGMYNVAIHNILVQPKCCQHNDNAWCHGHYWSLMIDHGHDAKICHAILRSWQLRGLGCWSPDWYLIQFPAYCSRALILELAERNNFV